MTGREQKLHISMRWAIYFMCAGEYGCSFFTQTKRTYIRFVFIKTNLSFFTVRVKSLCINQINYRRKLNWFRKTLWINSFWVASNKLKLNADEWWLVCLGELQIHLECCEFFQTYLCTQFSICSFHV